MKPVIEISSLGKKYKIGKAEPYLSVRDKISGAFQNVFKKSNRYNEDFWALQHINLKVEKGERLGILGKNGAGKSTLLKILSRITWPTTGEAIIRGRLASLLEVGTGFHPELSGRENIFLNGSMLGLKKAEIHKHFDAIVDFSGVEKFLDTSLKNYSTGMQLRLAFAVAAHLDQEILLIDEVLAVGDVDFQKKCIGKMEEVSTREGRTILFVSHNMAAIKRLCTKAVLIENGQLHYEGSVESCIEKYTHIFTSKVSRTGTGKFDISRHPNKKNIGSGLLSASMFVNNVSSEIFIPGSDLRIDITYKIENPLIDPEIGLVIKDSNNISYIGLNNKHIGQQIVLQAGKEQSGSICIPKLNILAPGKYTVDLFFGDEHHFYECLYGSFEFTVETNDIFRSGKLLDPELNKMYIDNITIKAS